MYIMYNVYITIIQNNYFCNFYLSISVYFGTGSLFVVDLELYVHKIVLELRDPSASEKGIMIYTYLASWLILAHSARVFWSD